MEFEKKASVLVIREFSLPACVSHGAAMSYASTSHPKSEDKFREWELQPQSEYRFELAQNTCIGIKVRSRRDRRPTRTDEPDSISSWMGMLSVLEQNLLRG